MTRRWLSLVAILAIVTASAACDGPRNAPTSSVVAPRAEVVTSNGYTLFTTDVGWEDGEITRSAVIDQNGGKVSFQASSLVVPAGAVTGPTTFRVTFYNAPYMRAQMTAQAADGSLVTTFPVPLTLTLSYARSKTPIPDPSRIAIFWVDNGVVLETQASSVDVQGKKVIARITHFSEYSPGLEPVDSNTTVVQ